jgi:hypothetical protein
MNQLVQIMSDLLDAFDKDKDLEQAQGKYRSVIKPVVENTGALSGPLGVALIELKEMLFVHPTFSKPIRDVRTSIQIIRDELKDQSFSSLP